MIASSFSCGKVNGGSSWIFLPWCASIAWDSHENTIMIPGEIESLRGLLSRCRHEGVAQSNFAEAFGAMLFLKVAGDFEGRSETSIWKQWPLIREEDLENWVDYFFDGQLRQSPHLLNRGILFEAYIECRDCARNAVDRIPRDMLFDMFGWVANQSVSTVADRLDLLGSFDLVLNESDGHLGAEYRSPASLAKLMVEVANPLPGEWVLDHSCGVGDLLSQAALRTSPMNLESASLPETTPLRIVGCEKNRANNLIAMVRLCLVGAFDADIRNSDCLAYGGIDVSPPEGFDLVISTLNGGKMRGRELDPGVFPVRSNDRADLLVQCGINQLRENGRAVFTVPMSFLFRSGQAARVREWILREHLLEAVVGLPGGVFTHHVGESAILVIHKGQGPTESVRFIDAWDYFTSKNRHKPAQLISKGSDSLMAMLRGEMKNENCRDVSFQELAEEDFDLNPERKKPDLLSARLEELGGKAPTKKLGELCGVVSGIHIKSDKLSERRVGESSLPYLRIGDIRSGVVKRASSWTSEDTDFSLSRHQLSEGDVVLSRSGTIGKAGVVSPRTAGGIASHGLFVIRSDSDLIDPKFLALYLESSDCKKWFERRAAGSVIRNIKKNFVEELPVPIPSIGIQRQVVEAVEAHGGDAFGQLTVLLSDHSGHPIANWVFHSLKVLADSPVSKKGDASSVVRNEVFGDDFGPIRYEGTPDFNPLPWTGWCMGMVEIADILNGCSQVPKGASYLNMLLLAADCIKSSAEGLDGEVLGLEELVGWTSDLLSQCVERIEIEIGYFLWDENVVITSGKDQITRSINELSVIVRNNGLLPLYNFSVSVGDRTKSSKPIFLPEKSEKLVDVEIKIPQESGKHSFNISWKGKGINGHDFFGEQEIAVSLIEDSEEGLLPSIGDNPYFHGPPVDPGRADVFFGREQLLSRIKNQIQAGNTVLLEGNRRAGKSSILKHLEGVDVVPGWFSVFSDLQVGAGDEKKNGLPSVSVWRALAESLATALLSSSICDEVPLPDSSFLPAGSFPLGITKACRRGISEEAPWEDFQEYFETVHRIVQSKNIGLVLMIDEFDKLEEGIKNGVTSPMIPENIRHLIQSKSKFVVIMTGSRRMKRLRNDHWSALYGLGTRIGVSALAEESARKLVVEPVAGRVTYSNDAVDLILELTASQPFLIQSLCNRIFEKLQEADRRTVEEPLVEEAAKGLVKDNEHFASLWDHARTDRRRLLMLISQSERSKKTPLTFNSYRDQMADLGIEVSDTDLDDDLKELRELELIRFSGNETSESYCLNVPLMGRWLQEHQDFKAVLARLLSAQERIDPEVTKNPYIVSSPIGDGRGDDLFAQSEEIKSLRESVAAGSNAVVLGSWGSGKTSVLKWLQSSRDGGDRKRCNVYLNCNQLSDSANNDQNLETKFWKLLLRSIFIEAQRLKLGLSANLIKPEVGDSRSIREITRDLEDLAGDGNRDERLIEVFHRVLRELSRGDVQLTLLLDDIEDLANNEESMPTVSSLLEAIRNISNEDDSFNLVLANASQRFGKDESISRLFHQNGKIFHLGKLDEINARKLVEGPVYGRFEYEEAAVSKILQLSGGMPFLIQLLCKRVIDLADNSRSRIVTNELVDSVSKTVVRDSAIFDSMWRMVGSDRGRYMLKVVQEAAGMNCEADFDWIRQIFIEDGIELGEDELRQELSKLIDSGQVECLEDSNKYRIQLSSPLFGKWIGSKMTREELREKLSQQ